MVLLAGPLIHRGRGEEAEGDCNQLWNHFILVLRLSDYDTEWQSLYTKEELLIIFPCSSRGLFDLIAKEEVLSVTLASDFAN